MYFSPIFAFEKLEFTPDEHEAITTMGTAFIVLMIVTILGSIGWGLLMLYRQKHTEKIEADRDLWFDEEESVLHRGPRQLKIPENTIEFYVCKNVFSERDKYHLDVNIIAEAGGDNFKERPVYFAVVRLNKKVKADLGFKEDLFIRGKQKTALNVSYR
ncbi:MAG TPA: hypothetical protein VD735_07685 [Candidatus Saccharimonadales bacterium]|nr:hypothetical protein [Candidatus Saccharimonadales bacterium]